jgi:peptidoglycan/xylan/chitin deacetylase (PgdA/CDA1 family)
VRIPVLLYHCVTSEPPPGLERWTVTEALFGEHLTVIADSGAELLTVSQLVARLRSGTPMESAPVVVTFDDGWADFAGAAERMAARGVPSTLYVTSDYLGRAGCLTPDRLRAAVACGVEVGAHGNSHSRLDELPHDRLVREVREPRTVLEDILQADVAGFAYPHGSYDNRVRHCVVEAGYESGVAVKHAFSHPDDDLFALARLMLTRDTSPQDLARLLRHEDAPSAWRGERLRTKAYRTYRRARHALPGRRMAGTADG